MGKKFSPKYRSHVTRRSPSYLRRRSLTFILLLGRDCICPLFPAHHAEHLTYENLGHEWPLRDLVPLNRSTHKFLTAMKDAVPGFRPINAWLLRGCYSFWIAIEAYLSWRLLQ